MFMGLIEGIGKIRKAVRKKGSVIFSIANPAAIKGLTVGESISVNGVCLTIVRKIKSHFEVQAVEETLRKSSLGFLQSGDSVNLERPLAANARLGGHFVLGHIDCVGVIKKIEKRRSSWLFRVRVPRRFSRYLIPVGSVAVNGVSLTVASVDGRVFDVSIIPQTMKMTTFQSLRSGESVNVEFDVLGKYVERILSMKRS